MPDYNQIGDSLTIKFTGVDFAPVNDDIEDEEISTNEALVEILKMQTFRERMDFASILSDLLDDRIQIEPFDICQIIDTLIDIMEYEDYEW